MIMQTEKSHVGGPGDQCKSEGRRARSARARGQERTAVPAHYREQVPVFHLSVPWRSAENWKGPTTLQGRGSAPLTADSMQVSSRKHPHTTGRNQACQPSGHPMARSGTPETNHEPKWRERKRARAGPCGHPSRLPHSTPGRASGRADEGGRSGEGCGSFRVNASLVFMKK